MKAAQNILIVENDEMTAEVIEIILEQNGYGAVLSDPSKLHADIAQYAPVLILMDLWLETVPGDELCRSLKADPQYAYIPVLLMSAATGLDVAARRCFADGYIEKPFDIEELTIRIAAAIASTQQN